MKTVSRTLSQLDRTYLWHPFTQMKEWLEEEHLIIEKGEGAFLYDANGNKYIDASSSIWCNVHGHNHPYLNKTISNQLSKICHSTLLGLANVPSILLAEKLVNILPKGLKRVFYGDSGSAAVEAALKMAVQYWHLKGEKRTTFLVLEGGYHGDTFGSMSIGYSPLFHKPFESMLFPVHSFPPPYLLKRGSEITIKEAEDKSIEEAEKILIQHSKKIAACIVEPLIQGAGGIWPHSPAYLKRVYNLVKFYNTLFIADEVAVGFGKTGTMFAVEQANITPDFICLGKGLTSGYLPLSATVTTEEIFSAFLASFPEFKALFHGHTFSGNPLACAAGIANLELFEKERSIEKLQTRIDILWKLLKEKFEPLLNVKEIRGCGFFAGIELGEYKTKSYPIEFRAGKKVTLAARKRGVIIRPLLDTIVLCPPLNIPEGVLMELFNNLLEAIDEVCH